MKKMLMAASVFALVQMMSTVASATPFAGYEGAYDVVGKTCLHNGEEVDCGRTENAVVLREVADGQAAAIDFASGLSYAMTTYESTGDIHEGGWARFSGNAERPMWTCETRLGDVVSFMVRSGVTIKVVPADGGADAVLSVTTFNFTGGRGTTSEERYTLARK